MFDVWLMLIFGVVGYVFKKLDYPLAPLVLAVVLGDRAEDAFRQAILGSGETCGSSGPTRSRRSSPPWRWCSSCGRR